MEEDYFGLGVMFTLLVMLCIWIVSGNGMIKETADGRYYIKTHFSAYELKSKQPMKLKPVLCEVKKDEKQQ